MGAASAVSAGGYEEGKVGSEEDDKLLSPIPEQQQVEEIKTVSVEEPHPHTRASAR